MATHLFQTEMSISVSGKQQTVTLDVSYIMLPHDTGNSYDIEILAVRAPYGWAWAKGKDDLTLDISWIMSQEVMDAIEHDIRGNI